MKRIDTPKENKRGGNIAVTYGAAISSMLFLVLGLFTSFAPKTVHAQYGGTGTQQFNQSIMDNQADAAFKQAIQDDIDKTLYEMTGRSADGTKYGSDEGASASVYAQVYAKTKDDQTARDAAYQAFLTLKPLIEDERTKAANLDFRRRSSTDIANDPVLKQQALDYEAAQKKLLTAKLALYERYGIGNEQSKQTLKNQIDAPTGSIITNQDQVMAKLRASEKAAGDVNNYDPIYCIRENPKSVAKEGASALVPDISIQGCIALGLYYGFLKPSSWVLWASGIAFNYSIDFTLNFGKFIRDEGLGNAGNGPIYLGWAAIRDLINVGFIFILLYMAIKTILNDDEYGVKKVIPKIVIAALLLNFSLFFTKAAIDLSNLVALQFYTRVLAAADIANSQDQALTRGNVNGDDWDGGLSIGIVNALGLKTIWATKDVSDASSSQYGRISAGQLIIVCLGGGAFILVTAFTLFMATIRFLYRSIVLIFLMILSPVGFVGSAIPPMKGVAGKWKGRLVDNLIFAPAYMAIFYVVALIVFGKNVGPSQIGANSGINGGFQGFASLFQGNVSGTSTLFWFIMIIGLMLGAQLAADSFADNLKIADTFKKKSKDLAISAMKNASYGYLGRRAVGNVGNWASQNGVVKLLARIPVIKQLGGQALYNKIGDLKDVKVGGASYTDAKKAREARDEKTRDRFSEVKAPKWHEQEAEFKARKDAEEEDKKAAHLKRIGVDFIRVQDPKNSMKRTVVVRPKNVTDEYKADDTITNRKYEKMAYDSAEFEAKKMGGVAGASKLAAIKKARQGNSGTAKGVEDQLNDINKKIIELGTDDFLTIKDGLKAQEDTARSAYAAAVRSGITGTLLDNLMKDLEKKQKAYTKHMSELTKLETKRLNLEAQLARTSK